MCNNLINNPISPYPLDFSCDNRTIGGIKKIWFNSRSIFGRWYYQETRYLQFGQIIGNESPLYFSEMDIDLKDSNFSEELIPYPMRGYKLTLNINLKQGNYFHRDFLENSYYNNDLVFIVQDYNNKYWCLGESKGMRIKNNFKTEQFKGNNSYDIVYECIERSPMREIEISFAQNITTFRSKFDTYSLVDLDGFTLNYLDTIKI